MNIGLISDTHGLLRPQALAALRGSELIVHAGDIGSAEVLEALRALAPVLAIRGNNDSDGWAQTLPETRRFEAGGQHLYLLHDLKTLAIDPHREHLAAIISGHSHRPSIERRDGVLYLNPGSAGPRRFSLPLSIARLQIDGKKLDAEIVELM